MHRAGVQPGNESGRHFKISRKLRLPQSPFRVLKNTRICLHSYERIFSAVIAGILIMPLLLSSEILAAPAANATVTATAANIRSIAGTGALSSVIAKVNVGDRVFVSDLVTISNDPAGFNSWYKVSAEVGEKQYDGYIVSSFVLKDPTVTDPDFEASISAFPESYKNKLRSLHEVHPDWVFHAVNVPADWNFVAAAQSELGISLIGSAADDSWKSTSDKAYDWLTNIYQPYDGTSWVNASKDVVAYYLDPRNFLSETYVFQFLNLSYDSGSQTQEAVQKLLNSTFMESATIANQANVRISYAKAFMQAGAASGASPYHLVSRVIQEVSINGSRSTSGKEPGFAGYYNYYNIGASSSVDPVILGLTYAKYGSNNPEKYPMSPANQAKYMIPWSSPFKSILGGAISIASNYIKKGQDTLYFQKFDVTDDGNGLYKHQYMTNIEAMIGESTTMYNAYAKSSILDIPLAFDIPVYTNMPETAAIKPRKTGNPNNYLKSLSIDGYSLTPSFDTAVSDGYSLIVPFEISSVKVSAAAVSAKASIIGRGTKVIQVGENTITVTVKAQNGKVKKYKITVIRSEQPGQDLFSTVYRVNSDNTIGGITPGSTVKELAAGFTLLNGGQIFFLSAKGDIITDKTHVIITGDRVQIQDSTGKDVYDFSAIIFGDVNCDGKINSTDLTLVCRYVLKASDLTGAAFLAADANHDGKVNSTDLTIICRHVLKDAIITQ